MGKRGPRWHRLHGRLGHGKLVIGPRRRRRSALGGMFITALLLGIVSDAVGDYVDDLKKGRSDVLETNHTLVLGWSDKTLPIVEQVSNANESEGGGGYRDPRGDGKGAPEELIAEFEYEALGTRVDL